MPPNPLVLVYHFTVLLEGVKLINEVLTPLN